MATSTVASQMSSLQISLGKSSGFEHMHLATRTCNARDGAHDFFSLECLRFEESDRSISTKISNERGEPFTQSLSLLKISGGIPFDSDQRQFL